MLIKCGSTEIDGYAFCLRLSALNLPYESYPDLQPLVYTATYLIRGALFRQRRGPSQSGRFFLQIHPLSELIDMYHTRKATERHDKVYALLGMSSDNNGNTQLLADYNISWERLFKQLIHIFLSEQESVDTWRDREVAIIRGKGYILGKISSVEKDPTWEDKQIVDITWQNELSGHGATDGKTSPWTIQAGAKAIMVGDVVCFLKGASKPTIIRPLDDHWAIIRIAVHPRGAEFFGSGKWSKTSPVDFPLVWDWRNSLRAGGYDKLFIRSQVPKPSELEEHLEKIIRLESMRLVFQNTKKYDALAENLRRIMELFERALGSMDKPAFKCIRRDELEE